MNRILLIVALAALLVAAPATALEKSDLLKAALIEKVASFIEWPRPGEAKLTLCTAADHPLLPAVRAFYDSVPAAERPQLQVVKKSEYRGCRVLLVTPREVGEPAEHARLRAAAEKDNILLIAEGAGSARQLAHIAFYQDQDGRLKLEANRRALDAAGLKPSFKLLENARRVD